MQINLKYKIGDRNCLTTLDIIDNYGFETAMDLAYNKSIYIVEKDECSILPVVLLAWSHNLLDDARNSENGEAAENLRNLSSFYRKLAHKVYAYQRREGSIAPLPGFLQPV